VVLYIEKFKDMGKLTVFLLFQSWSAVNNVQEAIMHLGWEKTLAKMYEYYWFDKMSKYVRKIVDSCITCRLSEPPTGKVQGASHSESERPVSYSSY